MQSHLENERSPGKEYWSPCAVLNAVNRWAAGRLPFYSLPKLQCFREFRSRSFSKMLSCQKLLITKRIVSKSREFKKGPWQESISGNGARCVSYVASLIGEQGKPGHLVPPITLRLLSIRCLFFQGHLGLQINEEVIAKFPRVILRWVKSCAI